MTNSCFVVEAPRDQYLGLEDYVAGDCRNVAIGGSRSTVVYDTAVGTGSADPAAAAPII